MIIMAAQQNYRYMRMNNMAIRDILKKRGRASNDLNKTVPVEMHPTSSFKEINFEVLLEKIIKLTCDKPLKCDLSQQQKYAIIEFISEKEKTSFNRHTLSSLMTVWKYPKIHELDIMDENPSASTKEAHHYHHKNYKNYFLLCGNLGIFNKSEVQSSKEKHNGKIFNLASDINPVFETETKLEGCVDIGDDITPIQMLEEFSAWGPLFKKKNDKKNICLFAMTAIVVELRNPEFDNLLLNSGGMDQDKKAKIIEHFPVFSSIGKRIQSILPYIQLKHYIRNEQIYKENEVPHAIYLIIKGEIIFEMKIHQPKISPKDSLNMNETMRGVNDTIFQTQTLGPSNYFGEEEVLNKCERKLTTICQSAECELLEIPIEKFEKLLLNSDFLDEIQANSRTRIEKREEKVSKALEIFIRMGKNSEKQVDLSVSRRGNTQAQGPRKKNSVEPPKVMHGNVIKRVRANNNDEIKFSMLKANPDMYLATMKKFRKFTMKPVEKYKPDVNWNLKRVWKVLNLENVLREDAEVSSPEGRKFYESSRRFQNHVSEVKSLRPKTSSSTYRTKLQYIAYLQQFNN